MPFFQDVDATGIVERHVKSIVELEDKEARRLLKRYKEARFSLQERLQYIPEDTFTAQQMRGILAQIEAGIVAMKSALKSGMAESAPVLATKGVENLLTEIKRFEQEFRGAVVPINLGVARIADLTTSFLLNKYEASIEAYSANLRAQITNGLAQSTLMGETGRLTTRRLVDTVGQFFLGEEWKLHRIARTELHNVYNVAKINGMVDTKETYIPDLMKALYHPMDARTGSDSKFLASIDPVKPINEPFEYEWGGKKRVFMVPPDRPNDRAILIPYRQAWDS